MNKIFLEIDTILSEISRFSDDILFLGPPIIDERLETFEVEIANLLSIEFKYLLKKHNGISLAGESIFGIDETLKGSSLDKVYLFEHFEAGNPMPKTLLPFSPDGAGNHYCLSLSKTRDGICPIVFWQHDLEYSADYNELDQTHGSLLAWIREVMIEWTLEDYNFDGTEKNEDKFKNSLDTSKS